MTEAKGLPVPRDLLDAMDQGRWHLPSNGALERVFGEKPSWPHLFGLKELGRHLLARLPSEQWSHFGLGPSTDDPDLLDPARALIIGDLGPDLPIALDYRNSYEVPRVVYLRSDGTRWVEVASSIADLIEQLGLAN